LLVDYDDDEKLLKLNHKKECEKEGKKVNKHVLLIGVENRSKKS